MILQDDRARTEEAQAPEDPYYIWGGGGYAFGIIADWSADRSRDFMDAIIEIHSDTLEAVEKLDPPAEAQAAHDEFVEVLVGLIATGKEIRDFVAGVEFTEGLQDAFNEGSIEVTDEVAEAFGRYHDLSHQRSGSCSALVLIAAQNNTDFVYDLCPGFD
jgi:hypothetical protein